MGTQVLRWIIRDDISSSYSFDWKGLIRAGVSQVGYPLVEGLCLLLDSPAALLLHWPLTIYQAIQLASAKQLIPETMDELCIHYLGPERELHQLAVFGELHALLPGVQLHIVFVGPSVPYDRDGETIALCSYAHCMEVNCSCKSGKGEFGSDITADKPSVITIRLHSSYYHDRYEELTKEFVPDLIITPNAGIADYRSWIKQKLQEKRTTWINQKLRHNSSASFFSIFVNFKFPRLC